MAGRRGQKEAVKTSFDSSTLVYVSMAAVLIVLSATLYVFGIDFGFIHFGGTPNVNILYGGAIMCIILAYIIDIYYVKAIKRYFRAKSSFLDYIPYINFIGIFGKVPALISWVLVVAAVLIAIPAYTPLGRFMPVDYLVLMTGNSIFGILGIMVIITFIRGYHSMRFKKIADSAYKKKISESYGHGGAMALASYIIYFLPIIRSISLFTDLNFINTVKRELDEMYRREER